MKFPPVLLSPLLIIFTTLGFQNSHAQNKPAVTPEDYGQFESFRQTRISPDGQWLAFVVVKVNEESELRIKNLSTNQIDTVKYGTNPTFSDDSKWLAYQITPSEKEKEKLQKDKKPIQNKAELLELGTKTKRSFDKIAQFAFHDNGRHLALKSYPSEKSESKGADLLVLNLQQGSQLNFGQVSEFAWSEKAPLIAMTISTASKTGNGIQLFNSESGTLQMLDAAESDYSQLSWREEANDLAVLKTREKNDTIETLDHSILAWTSLQNTTSEKKTFLADGKSRFPNNYRVSEYKKPDWSKDGSQIFFEIQPHKFIKKKEDTEKSKEEGKKSDVQVWHSKDLRIFPRQRSGNNRNSRRGLLCSWKLPTNEFLQIGTDVQEDLTILEGAKHAVETDIKPYSFGAKFGRPYQDLYLINLNSGQREKVLDKVRYVFEKSPDGNHILYFKGKDYFVYNIRQKSHLNLTKGLKVSFANEEYDYPVEQLPPFFIAGWAKDGKNVLINDQYDIWQISSDGSKATRLTKGREKQIIHRFQELDPEADYIDLSNPLYCRLTGRYSKQSGYARILPNRKVEQLILEDKYLSQLTKAEKVDRFIFSAQSFSESHNLFLSEESFQSPQQVTHLNAFLNDYAWGKSELVNFKSTSGKELQAALYYPANYDPSRKYPMIVYTYEILTNQIHRFRVPSERSLYNFSSFTSEGYFVLAPDIVYRAGDPGVSAVEAVEGAVKHIVDRGMVNEQGIGLVGHSWGGYQATYIPTQTDIFAASVAGAPITNFLSFMGSIHWNPGLPEVDHWETGQARMGAPYWEDFEAHVRNSPAAFVHKLKTPMLMAFGDKDGVVDWHQGVEFYNFARRAGNEDFILLVYPGEDHGIAGEEHRKDYNNRIRDWFAHHLKKEAAAKWIIEGVSFKEREEFLKEEKK